MPYGSSSLKPNKYHNDSENLSEVRLPKLPALRGHNNNRIEEHSLPRGNYSNQIINLGVGGYSNKYAA